MKHIIDVTQNSFGYHFLFRALGGRFVFSVRQRLEGNVMVKDDRGVTECGVYDFVVQRVVVNGIGDSFRFLIHVDGRSECNEEFSKSFYRAGLQTAVQEGPRGCEELDVPQLWPSAIVSALL